MPTGQSKYNQLRRQNSITEIIGKRFGRLLVLEFNEIRNSHTYFKCICDCGVTKFVSSNNLRNGHVSSCGCLRMDVLAGRKKHGMCNTRIYFIWRNMLNRCERPDHPKYKFYGALGVKVCKSWHSFINFYNDTKEGYADNLTLDRYPNKKGNYNKNNFRWATMKQQCRNQKSNVYLELNGERLMMAEWNERLGFCDNLINQRLSYGWSVERALTTPVLKPVKGGGFAPKVDMAAVK